MSFAKNFIIQSGGKKQKEQQLILYATDPNCINNLSLFRKLLGLFSNEGEPEFASLNLANLKFFIGTGSLPANSMGSVKKLLLETRGILEMGSKGQVYCYFWAV